MQIIWKPGDIETRSMEIIEQYVAAFELLPMEKAIIKRVIHTTGDPALVSDICIHPSACEVGRQAIAKGCSVFTDVNMTKVGINQARLAEYGGSLHCAIANADVAIKASEWGITRAAAAMRLWGGELDQAIIAIGNAPTALFELLDLIEKGVAYPSLIIGTPVGFVGAAESKEQLMRESSVPYISVRGTRGGSPIAATIVNALLYGMV